MESTKPMDDRVFHDKGQVNDGFPLQNSSFYSKGSTCGTVVANRLIEATRTQLQLLPRVEISLKVCFWHWYWYWRIFISAADEVATAIFS